ncbi:MAG: peptidylprolyl isomerase [Gemmatimonadetes bacterium]|nr:peptidylprolyl isomerase [Gemmatimonadota bacterium]
MVVVAVSFVGLMVFDWAMDLSGRSGGSSNAIGTVNDTEIPLTEYQRQYENLLDRAREENPDTEPDEERLAALDKQAWDAVVSAALLRAEADRRGIDVTDREVVGYVRDNPPAEMQQSPAFQTNGVFDPAKYRQALANPQLAGTWDQYASIVRGELPLRKLQQQVLAGLSVTDREVEDAFRVQNEQVRVDYLYLDPAVLVPDSAVRVSDQAVRDAYEDRKNEDFRRRSTARVRAVVWEARTTAADTARVRAELDSLRARALEGEAFDELASEYSQDPGSAQRGGDLGAFARGQMVPEFEQAAFSLAADSISQPFLSSFGWHLVKGGGIETDSTGAQRARARHILLRIEPSEDTFVALEDSASALAKRLGGGDDARQERGTALESLGAAAGDTLITTPPFERSDFVPGLGRVPEVADWVFESPVSSISPPIRSGSSVYLVEVLERTPAGYVPFASVRDQIRSELVLARKREKTAALADRATALVRQSGLDGAARELGLTVRSAGPFARSADLPEIGRGNDFIGMAFGLDPGETGGPVKLESGVYYLRVAERKPADMALLEDQRAGWRQQLLQEKASAIMSAWMEAVREQAEIEDYREDFLREADDDASPTEAPRQPPIF